MQIENSLEICFLDRTFISCGKIMKINRNTSWLLMLFFLGGVILVGSYTLPSLFGSSGQPVASAGVEKPEAKVSDLDGVNTVAQAWQWEAFGNTKGGEVKEAAGILKDVESETESENDIPFDVVFIYDALRSVKLDGNENVVLDHDALTALNETLNNNVLILDQLGLDKLQTLIKIGLPGKAGEQTARIVSDYYNYLEAKKEFNQIYATAENLQEHRSQYNEMLALRNLYLGEDVAQRLFEQEDLDAEYMFSAMKEMASKDSAKAQLEKAQLDKAEIDKADASKTVKDQEDTQ